jgi:2-polyprenyl-3-methyl-5-hydroxy-6-metoxy-1,4-benzoquinol methylase
MNKNEINSQLLNLENQKAYSKIARIYAGDAPSEEDPEMRATCRELFAAKLKGNDILEVGCGPGVDSYRLAGMGLNVTATDICKEFIEIVNSRFPEIKTHIMDMTAPSFPGQSFDGILLFAT